jgi:hypothetical protein
MEEHFYIKERKKFFMTNLTMGSILKIKIFCQVLSLRGLFPGDLDDL